MPIGQQTGSPFHGWWEYSSTNSSSTLHSGDAGTSGAGTAVTSDSAGLVVAIVGMGSGGTPLTVSSISGAGSNWGTWNFEFRSNTRQGGLDNIEVWTNVTTGAVNGVVTATLSASNLTAAADIRIFCFDSGASTTIGQTGTNSGATSAVSCTVTGVSDNSEVLFGCTNYTNANVPSGYSANVDSSWSQSMATNGGAYGEALTSAQSAGDITVSCTETSCTDWDAVAVEILAASVTQFGEVDSSPAVEQSEVFGPIRFEGQTAFQTNAFQQNAFQIGAQTAAGPDNKAEVDTATATENQNAVGRQQTAEVDTATLTDVEAAAGKQTAAEVDTNTASETQSRTDTKQSTAQADTATLTEVEAVQGTKQAGQTDTATATETEAGRANQQTAQIDTATATEAQDAKGKFQDTQVDTATALDTEGYTWASPTVDNKDQLDTATATETQDALGKQVTAQSDTATATDNYQGYARQPGAQVDAATALDNYQAYANQRDSQLDTCTALDVQGYAWASSSDNKDQIDTVTAMDACAATLAIGAGQVDTVTATDVSRRSGGTAMNFRLWVWDGANWV